MSNLFVPSMSVWWGKELVGSFRNYNVLLKSCASFILQISEHWNYLIEYPKKEYLNLKVKVQLISNTLCLEFFFKVSPKKKKFFRKRERERERKKEQAQLLRFFFSYYYYFFSNTFEHYYCVDYSALHMG